MNKELEVYIKAYKEIKKNREIINSIDSDFFFDFADTMLNYIENSIPKKVIEEKINRFKDETVWNYNDWKYDEKIYKAELNIIDKIMKELLEGK